MAESWPALTQRSRMDAPGAGDRGQTARREENGRQVFSQDMFLQEEGDNDGDQGKWLLHRRLP